MENISSAIPIVDLAPLGNLDGVETLPSDAIDSGRAIADAGRGGGFFYAVNHGLPADFHRGLFKTADRFFDLPSTEKMKLFISRDTSKFAGGYIPLCGETTNQLKDWHEALDVQPAVGNGGAPIWPFGPDAPISQLPWLRDALAEAWPTLEQLAFRIASGIAVGLGLPPAYFRELMPDPLGVIRLALYPKHPTEGVSNDIGEGIGEHTDYGFLTVVAQDGVGGLEVRGSDGVWRSAPHREDAFVVLLGRVVPRLTNDGFSAATHRVRIPRDSSRVSVSYFLEPGYHTPIAPLPSCVTASSPPRYEPCEFGDLMALRYQVSFGGYATSSLAAEAAQRARST